ncbi:uncharacterized protein LOC129232983, partial [Uloborus diversus]|uniref:uncharacterized protein LOC129232983 n=1 Tax=Uloborus diversus TaxID=327109 RepID=UPI002409487E
MAVEQGFTKAQSDNLPIISEDMIVDFFKENLDFLSAEIKGVKAEKSTRGSYADNAVGYVQVRHLGDVCTVKARMTPEYNVRKKAYGVSLDCNEAEHKILLVQCDGCAVRQGGSINHGVPMLLEKIQFVMCWDIQQIYLCTPDGKKNIPDLPPKEPTVVEEFMALLDETGVTDLQLCSNFSTTALKENLSLHILKMNFQEANAGGSADEFLLFIQSKMTSALCQEAENASRYQAKSSKWHELRYGRITASKIHEASRCKTFDGSLVEALLGAKFKLNAAIKRGTLLEKDVLNELKKRHRSIKPSGFLMNADYPFVGASPDGVTKDFVVEIKCPSTEQTMGTYFKN